MVHAGWHDAGSLPDGKMPVLADCSFFLSLPVVQCGVACCLFHVLILIIQAQNESKMKTQIT